MSTRTSILIGLILSLAWGCLWWRLSGLCQGLFYGGAVMAGWFVGDVIKLLLKRMAA